MDCKKDVKDLESYLKKSIRNTNEILKRVKENECATRNEIILIMLVFLAIFILSILLILNFKFD